MFIEFLLAKRRYKYILLSDKSLETYFVQGNRTSVGETRGHLLLNLKYRKTNYTKCSYQQVCWVKLGSWSYFFLAGPAEIQAARVILSWFDREEYWWNLHAVFFTDHYQHVHPDISKGSHYVPAYFYFILLLLLLCGYFYFSFL